MTKRQQAGLDHIPNNNDIIRNSFILQIFCSFSSDPLLSVILLKIGPLAQKNRLNRRFFCILSLIFVVLEIAVLRRFQWWNSGRGMSERSRRNRQIPNPSLTGKLPHFLRFYRCRCRPLLIVCLRCVGREAGFLLL